MYAFVVLASLVAGFGDNAVVGVVQVQWRRGMPPVVKGTEGYLDIKSINVSPARTDKHTGKKTPAKMTGASISFNVPDKNAEGGYWRYQGTLQTPDLLGEPGNKGNDHRTALQKTKLVVSDLRIDQRRQMYLLEIRSIANPKPAVAENPKPAVAENPKPADKPKPKDRDPLACEKIFMVGKVEVQGQGAVLNGCDIASVTINKETISCVITWRAGPKDNIYIDCYDGDDVKIGGDNVTGLVLNEKCRASITVDKNVIEKTKVIKIQRHIDR